MRIEDFLLARISDVEDRIAMYNLPREDWLMVLRMCNAQKALIELHKNWPVMIEGPPDMDVKADNFGDHMRIAFTKQLEWMTQEGYRMKFGTEPPTAPMLRTWAQQFQDHLDFQEEWR